MISVCASHGLSGRMETRSHAFPATLTQESGIAGTYRGRAPSKDAARRVYTLNLAADGTALLTTLYIGKDDTAQRGNWTQNGNQIVLTFAGTNQPPRPITFRHRNHELKPLRWDASEWGRSGPPVLHLGLK